ncbi:hypothetical protein ACLI4U_19105 (plasmid) [Natrialbaceae archaeon A-CW2]
MLTGDTDLGRMTRALLTDGERDAIRGDTDMDASTRSSHRSRVRGKMERMATDARLLREHDPELYEQLREAVVEEDTEERLARLEEEVEQLRKQVE